MRHIIITWITEFFEATARQLAYSVTTSLWEALTTRISQHRVNASATPLDDDPFSTLTPAQTFLCEEQDKITYTVKCKDCDFSIKRKGDSEECIERANLHVKNTGHHVQVKIKASFNFLP